MFRASRDRMTTGKQSASLILSLVTILLAVIAGVAIPLASGGGLREEALAWTPPPSRTATSTAHMAARATPTLPPRLTATSEPTHLPPPATPAITPVVATVPSEPTATLTPTALPTPTATEQPTPTPSPTFTPAAPIARVIAEPVNLRSGPGTDFPPLGIARLGEVYTLQGRSADGGWYQICCVRDAPAWISASLIATEGITETLPILP